MSIDYIIIQAGGKGTRLGHLTRNKPKAMVSVKGMPIIINTMKLYPKAHFLIIIDYKAGVLDKYLKLFAPAKYTLVNAGGEGTASGIKHSMKLIPPRVPFLVSWCDLFFEKKIYPENLDFKKKNYIGLSRDFSCRLSFQGGKITEEESCKKGMAGVFIFKNKNELKNVPLSGEFGKFLRETNVPFSPFYLKGVMEVGLFQTHQKIREENVHTRPFNQVVLHKQHIIKKPVTEQGRKIALDESAWYKYVKGKKLDFIPEVRSYKPIILERIQESSLFDPSLSRTKKQKLIDQMIRNLKTLHSIESKNFPDAYANNKEAIVSKTKKRLDSIISLIPYAEDKYITINNKKCLNFYKSWDIVEKLCEPYLSDDRYVFIHGDPHIGNYLYNRKNNKLYLIDPRGYYGNAKLIGDEDYDWTKVYYSIEGNFDQFNRKNFFLTFTKKGVQIDIMPNGWEKFGNYFLNKIKRDKNKIKLFHAMIWLSLTSYAWDDYDSVCGAFYRGIYLMQECYEKQKKS